MTLQSEKQLIATQISPNISKSKKDIQRMKLG